MLTKLLNSGPFKGYTISQGSKDDPIEPGAKWQLKDDKSPWPQPTCLVTILDVKDGWVRYYMGRMFPDQRMEEDLFRKIYEARTIR
jgi:hypothetical protein